MSEPRDYRIQLDNILTSIGKVQKYIHGMSLTDFVDNDMLIDAVAKRIEDIGDNVKELPLLLTNGYPHIPWRAIARMRDRLAHHYATVDPEIVWATAQRDLDELADAVRGILYTLDSSSN